MEGIFRKEDLYKINWQYSIRHTSVNTFECGEKIFLKSSPSVQMEVYSINDKYITAFWYTENNEKTFYDFVPETILQYKYAGLMTYREKYTVSLN